VNADLRRAVSAAYYALFHKLTLTAAEALLPAATQEQRWQLGRHFGHGEMRRVCEWVTGPPSPPAKYKEDRGRRPAELPGA
jgi:hypothetical protein